MHSLVQFCLAGTLILIFPSEPYFRSDFPKYCKYWYNFASKNLFVASTVLVGKMMVQPSEP